MPSILPRWLAFRPNRLSLDGIGLLTLFVVVVILSPSIHAQPPIVNSPTKESPAKHPFCGTSHEAPVLPDPELGREGGALRGAVPGFERGDTVVLVDDGTLSFLGFSISPATARAFFDHRHDDYDQVAFFNDFGLRPEMGFAFSTILQNTVQGLGRDLVDRASMFSLPTQRLSAFVNMNSLTRLPPGPFDPVTDFIDVTTPVTLLAHELGHQWLAGLEIEGFRLLGRDGGHWNFYLDNCASVMEGNRWRDNQDGTFTTVESFTGHGELDEYAMGLRPAEQVSPQILVTQHPGGPPSSTFPMVGVTVNGVGHTFSISDVEAKVGKRLPAAIDSPHLFRIAFALVIEQGRDPAPADLASIEAYRIAYENLFRIETEGLGAVMTRLDVPAVLEVDHFQDDPGSNRFGLSVAADESAAPGENSLFVVGAPKLGPGRVVAYSTLTGRKLWSMTGRNSGDNFGLALQVLPDLDGDGISEVAVGAPGLSQGVVSILRGSSGMRIVDLETPPDSMGFGRSIALTYDVDGGGNPDLLVGAPRSNTGAGNESGAVFVSSLDSGAVLARIDGSEPGGHLGMSVSSPGDLNADGIQDFVASSPRAQVGSELEAGSVTAYSGVMGEGMLWRVSGETGREYFGLSLDSSPDIDGDGVSEVLLGAPGFDRGSRMDAGRVLVLSGESGAQILSIPGGGDSDGFGSAVCSIPDVDQDGVADIAVGSPGADPGGNTKAGLALVFSSRDGALLSWLEGDRMRDGFGSALAAVPGDHGARLLVGAAGFASRDPGKASVFEISPFRLSTRGDGVLGTSLALRLHGGKSGERYAIVISPDPGPTPLPFPLGPGSSVALDVGADMLELTRSLPGFQGVLDPSGQATIQLSLPARAEFLGREFHVQAVVSGAPGSGPPKVRRATNPISIRLK